jgi:hypothetical protein
MEAQMSIYNARGVRTIDGDSFVCTAKVNAIIPDSEVWSPKVRLVWIDAAERGEPNWGRHRDFLDDWLFPEDSPLTTPPPFNLICYGRDKYGRMLADAERGTGLLSDYLRGLSVPLLTARKLADLAPDVRLSAE